MSVLLKDLMQMPCFEEAKLVAGTIEDKNIQVEGITIIEAHEDIVDWIRGGELLLTSFYSIASDLEAQKILIKDLGNSQASAIIIKTSRFLSNIPDELIKLGNELDFPIIEISGDTKYIDITYPVMAEIFNGQMSKLNYHKECHERFTELTLKMKGKESIAKTLSELVGNPVIIFDNEFNQIAWNDESYMDMEIVDENVKDLVRKGYPFYGLKVREFKGSEKEKIMIMEPIQVLDHIKGYLGVIEVNREMRGLNFIALETAATALRLEMLKDVAVTEVELKYKGDLMDDLINGRFESIKNIYDRADSFGWDLRREFIVCLINIDGYEEYIKRKKSPTEGLHKLRNTIENIITRISYYYTTDHIYINKGDNIIILWPVEKSSKENNIYTKIKDFSKELKRIMIEEIHNIYISIGIGGLVKDPSEIEGSYCEAKDAVSFGYRIFGKNSITVFDELGIYKLLCNYQDRNELKKFIHPDLLTLQKYDREKNNELLDTLETYLTCNLNAVKTAEELFVHYKTVLYRLNRIKELTKLDIENRKKMLEIEVGLKILRIID